jgi:hypothetical protein
LYIRPFIQRISEKVNILNRNSRLPKIRAKQIPRIQGLSTYDAAQTENRTDAAVRVGI